MKTEIINDAPQKAASKQGFPALFQLGRCIALATSASAGVQIVGPAVGYLYVEDSVKWDDSRWKRITTDTTIKFSGLS